MGANAADLRIEVYDGDDTMAGALQRAGFVVGGAPRSVGLFRPAEAANVTAPAGYRLRAVREDEFDARVAVHRAAWRPASLPWADDRVLDPDATSSFNAEAYETVRNTWLYDPELDLVAEAADGSLAACCIVWLDPAIGVAEIEPMGVAPEHRNRGLAVALCLTAAARVAERGGTELFINTGARPEYPAPAGAYMKAGFVERERATTHVLRR
jgi:ribosomal protein S18 acetylase RimI-like enzyme